jgi:hypothetical protein
MATYTLISSNVLSSSAASVTFSSIPATYTDLVIRASVRGNDATRTFGAITIKFNADTTTNYSYLLLFGNGSSASADKGTSQTTTTAFYTNGDAATANSFGNIEIYIPSYTASQNKPLSSFGVSETNDATARMGVAAGLWRNTAAITTITLTDYLGTNFLTSSSFYLYGISNA